jgi:hypothetical protein
VTGPAKSTAKTTKTAKEAPDPEPELCSLCWPDGWPSDDTHRGHCVHGEWSRDLPDPS